MKRRRSSSTSSTGRSIGLRQRTLDEFWTKPNGSPGTANGAVVNTPNSPLASKKIEVIQRCVQKFSSALRGAAALAAAAARAPRAATPQDSSPSSDDPPVVMTFGAATDAKCPIKKTAMTKRSAGDSKPSAKATAKAIAAETAPKTKADKKTVATKASTSRSSSSTAHMPKATRPTKTMRQAVWTRQCGASSEGTCLVCKAAVTVWNFDVCHRVAKANGGTMDCANLFVGCHECNLRQGTMNLEDYLRRHKMTEEDTRRARYLELHTALLKEQLKPSSSFVAPVVLEHLRAGGVVTASLLAGTFREEDLPREGRVALERARRHFDPKKEVDDLWAQLHLEEDRLRREYLSGKPTHWHKQQQMELARLVLSELRSGARRGVELCTPAAYAVHDIRLALWEAEEKSLSSPP